MAGKITRVAIAPDSFKGCMTALEAATIMARGIHRALGRVSFKIIPMADGGEGTVRAIIDATGGRLITAKTTDPLGRHISAHYGITGDGKTAVIEMAEASGLVLLKPRERNPLKTSTRGTGTLIRHALERGARRIVVGIGGSATNDGGTGMARALGVRFLDGGGRQIPEGGGSLRRLARIDMSCIHPSVRKAVIDVACDVTNPLVGPHGASRVYSPQKGATPAMVRKLEAGLQRLAAVTRKDLNLSIARTPGGGAAGGLGAGLMAFLGGTLRPGVDIVVDTVGLKRQIRNCDVVVTGEGRMDGQTVFGKTPVGVARAAREMGIPVIAVAGSLGKGARAVIDAGIDAFFATIETSYGDEEIAARAPGELERCIEQVFRVIAMDIPGKKTGRPAGRKKSRS